MTNNQKKTNDTAQKKQPKKIGTVTQQQQQATRTSIQTKRNNNKVNDEDPNEILIAINNYEKYIQNQSTHLKKQQQVYNEAIQKSLQDYLTNLTVGWVQSGRNLASSGN